MSSDPVVAALPRTIELIESRCSSGERFLKGAAAAHAHDFDAVYLVVTAPQKLWRRGVPACGLLDSADYRLPQLTNAR